MATSLAPGTPGDGTLDATLAVEMAGGSSEAFDELYRRHVAAVRHVGSLILGDDEAADDVAQEAFLRLWLTRRVYDRGLGTIRTWVLAIARNRAIDVVRTRFRQARVVDDARQTARWEEHAPDALTEALVRDRSAELHLALAELPQAQRLALVLAFGGGLSHREVARRTGTPLGTVKGRLRLGQQRMALRMDDTDG
jgi:RNA polymerase sigma-70 factor, ECF subfamily